MIKKYLFLSILSGAILGLPTILSAATLTANLYVSAKVSATCSITVEALNFGLYSPIEANDDLAETKIHPYCTNGDAYMLTASGGLHGTILQRKMTDGNGNQLDYNVYVDKNRRQVWGNGLIGKSISGTGTGKVQSLTIYGKIPAKQAVVPARYSDTDIVTLTYTV